MDNRLSDFLIVGAGAVGLASALELARRGARVTVLDRADGGTESTWAGGGILSPLLPWQYGEAVNALSEYSRGLFPDWLARLEAMSGLDAEYLTSGMLVLPPFQHQLALDWCARHGWRCEARQNPAVSPGAAEALWLPDVAQARNPRLARVLRQAADAAGIRIVQGAEVTALVTEHDRVSRVATTRGDFTAAGYIVAAGAWSGVIPGLNNLAKRIFPVRGQMLLFKLAPESLSCIVLQNGAYLIPRKDGHLLAGSTLEWCGFDKSTTASARRDLQAFAADILPVLRDLPPTRHWSGLRPGSPDNIPLIAAHPGYANLFINSGHFRYGVTMAPGSAMLLADLVEGVSPAIPAAPYAEFSIEATGAFVT